MNNPSGLVNAAMMGCAMLHPSYIGFSLARRMGEGRRMAATHQGTAIMELPHE